MSGQVRGQIRSDQMSEVTGQGSGQVRCRVRVRVQASGHKLGQGSGQGLDQARSDVRGNRSGVRSGRGRPDRFGSVRVSTHCMPTISQQNQIPCTLLEARRPSNRADEIRNSGPSRRPQTEAQYQSEARPDLYLGRPSVPYVINPSEP